MVLHYKNITFLYEEARNYTIGDTEYVALINEQEQDCMLCRYISNMEKEVLRATVNNAVENTEKSVEIIALVSSTKQIESIIDSYRKEFGLEHIRKEHRDGSEKIIC